MQLDLPLWSRTSVKAAISDYRKFNSDGLAEGTLIDYDEREKWLLGEFGEATEISTITYDRLYLAVRHNQDSLANVTLKKRLDMLRWALVFAHGRDLLAKVPMFPKLRNDGRTMTDVHTVGEWEAFRMYLPAGPFRKLYDLAFWTLQHVPDVMTMERWMLDPEYVIGDERGEEVARGAFWRRNAKNNNPRKRRRPCKPMFIPSQPELKLIHAELMDGLPERRDALIVGKLWNVQRTLNMAYCRAVADGKEIPRITPTGLRRSGASMLTARGWSPEAVRIALGHQGEFRPAQLGEKLGRLAGHSTTATNHYIRAVPGLFTPRP